MFATVKSQKEERMQSALKVEGLGGRWQQGQQKGDS